MAKVIYASSISTPRREIAWSQSFLKRLIEFLGLIWQGVKLIGEFFEWLADWRECSGNNRRTYQA
jgi:hypothetical protein